ncbi:hypothetical protein M0R04_04290 [Candidatus Dojkabacteria bacterium]|jgi:hypothetical protein|nr:hypothetical protein [Candidatus Dojkabacteria bacterium]
MDILSFIVEDPPILPLSISKEELDIDSEILKEYQQYELSKSHFDKPKNIQVKVDNTVDDVVYGIDCIIDNYIENHFQGKLPNFIPIFKDRVNKNHAKSIIFFVERSYNEFKEVLETTDPDLLEAYSNFSKYEINKLVEIYKSIMDICIGIFDVKKSRKQRKLKEKSAEKLVSKVKICKEFSELNLKSVEPKNIIGSLQIWVYDVKYKKLGCYYSKDQLGFSVKGTTIQNFDEARSIQKIVRKPKDVLENVIVGSNLSISKALDTLKTTQQSLTGRLSENIIILRTIR